MRKPKWKCQDVISLSLSASVIVIDASHKSFGLALAAATRHYTTDPGLYKATPTASMFTVTFDFNPANPDLQLSEKTMRLLADETQNPGKIIPEDKLDSRLKYQKSPLPSATFLIGKLTGLTVVEFLVDEAGRVHLPRIIKTATPEAAHAFMQQISLRTYDPPMQNGNPVVARARETVNFDKSPQASAGR